MNRIALLSEHRAIQISKNAGRIQVTIGNTETPLFLILDWSQIEVTHIDIEILGCKNVDILEISDARDTEIRLLVDAGAILNWGMVAFNHGKKSMIHGILEKNALVNVAFADFSLGNESLDAMIVLHGDH